jgi:hypothetical protein
MKPLSTSFLSSSFCRPFAKTIPAAGVALSVVALFAVGAIEASLSGCSFNGPTERYVSPHIEGATSKINLEAVQKAFWDTKGSDLNAWMGAFEKRVNEIYDGKEIVSIDATREKGRLLVTGYIDQQKKQGYVAGDEKLFTIEQTGDAVNNQMPYQVSGQNGQVFYQGQHSILDNPFLQAMLISHMMGGWGGHYYTPYDRYGMLDRYRDTYRQTPSYSQQQAYNRDFSTRFKTKSFGGDLQSSNSFGKSGFSSAPGTRNRSWGSSSFASPSASSTSSWGGRRSSGFGSSYSGSSFGRSWGGRRR